MNKTIYYLLTLTIACVTSHVAAQNTTNLPTSMYGVGELNAVEGGRYAGMGNVGIALNRVGMLNTLNPAAATRMDTTCFTFEVGVVGSYARYSFLSDRSSNLTGNPNRIAFAFRALKGWYVQAGMAPYSSMGYLIQTEEPVEGKPGEQVYSQFEGTGGLYRLYLSNAFRLTPRLSLGVNVGAIRGKTVQSETQESATIEVESAKRAFYLDFGVHYEWPLRQGRSLSAGIVASPSLPISQDNELTYSSTSTDEALDESQPAAAQYLPLRLGVGMAYATPRWTLAAIYTMHPRSARSAELMGGIGLSNAYMTLKGGQMYYLEASLGAGFPVRQSFLSVGGTWRRQVNTRASLMREDRWSITLSITFGERLSKSKLK